MPVEWPVLPWVTFPAGYWVNKLKTSKNGI